jgi:hypothetical protein
VAVHVPEYRSARDSGELKPLIERAAHDLIAVGNPDLSPSRYWSVFDWRIAMRMPRPVIERDRLRAAQRRPETGQEEHAFPRGAQNVGEFQRAG